MGGTFNTLLSFFTVNSAKRIGLSLIIILGAAQSIWGVGQLLSIGNVAAEVCIGSGGAVLVDQSDPTVASLEDNKGDLVNFSDQDEKGVADELSNGTDYSQIDTAGSVEVDSIYVDVSGAVLKPGIYQLGSESRLADALKEAGGVSLEADPVYFAQKVNLALTLHDGQKLYFPFKEEQKCQSGDGGNDNETIPESVANEPLTTAGQPVFAQISINHATVSELDKLDGIGEKRAQQIIDNRPYSLIDELVTKKVISQTIFDQIKDQIIL